MAVLGIGQPAQACQQTVSCNNRVLGVTVDNTASYTVRGQLCRPTQMASNTAVVFVAGFSYKTSKYFDPAYMGGAYSQAKAVQTAGFATFVYDQIGTGGNSENPLDNSHLSLVNQSEILFQVTRWVKAQGYRNIVVIGHSLGYQEALWMANAHPTAIAGVAGFGYLRQGSALASARIAPLRVAGQQAAAYTNYPWAANSQTTKDGVDSRSIFYDTTAADPGMIAYDEANKGIAPNPTVAQIQLLRQTAGGTDNITAPVFDGTGGTDILGCSAAENLDCSNTGAIVTREKPYFPNTACFTPYVAPGVGHDVNLSYGASITFAAMNRWIAAITAQRLNRTAANCA